VAFVSIIILRERDVIFDFLLDEYDDEVIAYFDACTSLCSVLK